MSCFPLCQIYNDIYQHQSQRTLQHAILWAFKNNSITAVATAKFSKFDSVIIYSSSRACWVLFWSSISHGVFYSFSTFKSFKCFNT